MKGSQMGQQEYGTTTSVTSILNNLKWSTLSERWQYSRFTRLTWHHDQNTYNCYLPSTMSHCTQSTHRLHLFHHSHLQHTSKRISSLVQ